MIKLILLAFLISLSSFAQDLPETMPEETADYVTSEVVPEDTVAVPEVAPETIPSPVEEAAVAIGPVVEEDNTPVVTTEETPAPVVEAPVAKVEESVKTPVMTTEAPEKEDDKFNPLESHWITSFGFEGMKYETANEFSGVKKNFKLGDAELYGGRIGVGGEIYLGLGILTTTKVEGYYMGTLFSQVLNGGEEDDDVKFAYTKQTGQIYGVDASQSLGFIFDMKTKNPFMEEMTYLTVEPYIEVGAGAARAYNRTNYSYVLASTDEQYRLRVSDQLVNAKVGAGINFTSTSGYFLYVKATQNRYDITKRDAYKLERTGGGPNVTSKPELDDKIKAITVYAIGGGYKF